MKIYLRLPELLKEHELTQKELAELTGIRAAGINDMVNYEKKMLNRRQLEKIAEVLDLEDISELIVFKDE